MNAPHSSTDVTVGQRTVGQRTVDERTVDRLHADASAEGEDRSEPADPAAVLEPLQQELNRIQRSVRLTLQAHLQSLVGRSLGSLASNREMAKAIQTLLETHSLRVRCQQCGHPAILRVSPRKGMSGGAFVFDHTVHGRRTFHGGVPSVPPLHLVAKPKRAGG